MKQEGFSLIELLVVFSLTVILAGGGIVAYGQVRQSQEMESVAMKVGQIVNSGRVKSVTGEDDSSWKIKWTADGVWLENAKGEKEEEYRLAEPYNLSGPGSELEFSRADGRVEECLTGCDFEVRRDSGASVYQFRVLFSGVAEY